MEEDNSASATVAAARMSSGGAVSDSEILIPADGIRQSVPWRLRHPDLEQDLTQAAWELVDDDTPMSAVEIERFIEDHVSHRMRQAGFETVLTETEVVDLATRFAFPQDELTALARDLALCLDTDASPLRLELPLEIAAKRGRAALDQTREDMARAADLLTRGLVRLDPLTTAYGADAQAAERFARVRTEYEALVRQLEALHRKLTILHSVDDVVQDLSPADRRAVPDLRRKLILWRIFGFWTRHRGKPTITTDSVDDQRKGPLIDFINSLVQRMTDPPAALSGQTIWRDLHEYLDEASG